MSDAADTSIQRALDPGLVSYVQVIYGLHAFAVLTGIFTSSTIAGRFLFGLPSIVAVIMNYARRAAARGTWLETHFEWQIHTFWYALLWIGVTLLISAPLTLIVIGIFIAYAGIGMVGLWVAYRVARGWLALRKRHPMPRHAPPAAVAGT